MSLTIKCPNCGSEIQIDEAMESQFKDQVSDELRASYDKQRKELEGREKALKDKESDLHDEVEKQLDEQLKIKTAEIEAKAIKKATESTDMKMKAIEEELAEKATKLDEARKKELDMAKRERELKDKEAEMEIDLQKRLTAESEIIRIQAKEKADEENRFKDIESAKQQQMLQDQIEQLKRQLEQGSQQLQGEAQEIELKDILERNFAIDIIEDVKTGARGADIIQKVKGSLGNDCGTILWESKRAKAWAGDWPEKLKADQRKIGAEIAVMYSSVLPKEINGFGFYAGIWVTNYQNLIPLTTALRIQLEQVALAHKANENVQDKAQLVYRYITSPQFSQKVRAITDAFTSFKEDLDKERNAMQRLWKKREARIDMVLSGVIGVYGDLEGISGHELEGIDSLELDSGLDDDIGYLDEKDQAEEVD